MPLEKIQAVKFTEAEELKMKQEAVRLALTPEQAKFIKWVKEVTVKGYVPVNTIGFANIISTEDSNLFIVNPIDGNGNLYNIITIAINTDEIDGNILLPTISQIIPQDIYPTITDNFGFQLKIFNSGSNGNNVYIQSAVTDGIGSETQIELGDNASAILSPTFTNNWSIQLTK
jgi:hypothetical protein